MAMGGRRKAPAFPGFEKCLSMFRKRDAMTQEQAYFLLQPRVSRYAEPLMAALETEADPRVQSWLLELLGEARNPAALPMFARYLSAERDDLRCWARSGIAELAKTSEGRRILWGIYLSTEAVPEGLVVDDVERLRSCIAEVLGATPPRDRSQT